jgi:hypothetical protein
MLSAPSILMAKIYIAMCRNDFFSIAKERSRSLSVVDNGGGEEEEECFGVQFNNVTVSKC